MCTLVSGLTVCAARKPRLRMGEVSGEGQSQGSLESPDVLNEGPVV